jgi:hypothetical protein
MLLPLLLLPAILISDLKVKKKVMKESEEKKKKR